MGDVPLRAWARLEVDDVKREGAVAVVLQPGAIGGPLGDGGGITVRHETAVDVDADPDLELGVCRRRPRLAQIDYVRHHLVALVGVEIGQRDLGLEPVILGRAVVGL